MSRFARTARPERVPINVQITRDRPCYSRNLETRRSPRSGRNARRLAIRNLRRFGNDSICRHLSDLVGAKFGKEKVVIVSASDLLGIARRGKEGDLPGRGYPANHRRKAHREPDVAIRAVGNRTRRFHVAAKLGNNTLRRNPANLASRQLRKPKITITSRGNVLWKSIWSGNWESRERVGSEIDAPDVIAC
jgi:hypothetical protein